MHFHHSVRLAWISVLLPALANAHAVLLKSDPHDEEVRRHSPERVIVWYNQEIETRLSTLRVFDGQGRRVDKRDGYVDLNDPDHTSMIVSLPVPLPVSRYMVRWTAVSAEDGDRTKGKFIFRVANEKLEDNRVRH